LDPDIKPRIAAIPLQKFGIGDDLPELLNFNNNLVAVLNSLRHALVGKEDTTSTGTGPDN
jgi:hypothetical protein